MRRTEPRLLHVALAAAMLVGACTRGGAGEAEWPSLADAAEGFFDAWSDGDFAEMTESMAESSAAGSTEARLDRFTQRQFLRGAVVSFLAQPSEVDQPDDADFEAATAGEEAEPLEVAVGYRVTYESEASDAPVELAGEFPFVFDGEDEVWLAEFDGGAFWPGIDGAGGFDITTRWPKRGAILDRDGRRLAIGPAEERRYPFGSVGGSTIGHIETVTKGNLEAHEGAEVGDLVGGSGLERGLDDLLAGEPSAELAILDSGGDVIEVVGAKDAVPGENVKVTLDIDLQRAAESAYGSTVGGAAVTDPRSGDLLAAVASGPFNPNNYVGATGVAPFNRALVGNYPPGSSMKVVTAAAALEEGVVTPRTTVTGPKEYQGVRNFESGEFGAIPFSTAVQNSVNTAFAQVAQKLGSRRMTVYAERFGFNRLPDLPLEAAEPSFPAPGGLGDLMWASIGQAQVLASPLQMATVAATIANDGKRMEPRLVRSNPKSGERAVSRRTAAQMTELMRAVVIAGTGTAANISGADVAGKTGTAEVDVNGERLNHAWFVSFAPAGDPRVAVAVVAEYGGVGGQVAAPVAGRILQAVLPLAR